MTLDEAIKRYNNNAEHERTLGNLQGCLEFRQLAEWLKDYKRLLESSSETKIDCDNADCNNCVNHKYCDYESNKSEIPTGSIHCQHTDAEIAKSFIEDVAAAKDQLPGGDQMDFPNTFEEFAKDYGFKDKDEVYTNGSELIPVFRVRQWLEHISTTKNDLGVDCISRAEVNRVIEDYRDEQYHVLSDRTKERAFGAKVVMARINELPSVTPQPCEDCISRQAVFETIDDCNSDGLKGIFCSYRAGLRFKEYIKDLPSVTLQEPIEKCTWIKYDYRTMRPKDHNGYTSYWRIPENRMDTLKYCPYCGKEIEEEFILNKLRAEIERMTPTYHNPDWSITDLASISDVLDIIDKYKTESEEEVSIKQAPEEQEPVLDKIRSEIIEKYWDCDICKWKIDYKPHYVIRGYINDILQILDKYKAEVEPQEKRGKRMINEEKEDNKLKNPMIQTLDFLKNLYLENKEEIDRVAKEYKVIEADKAESEETETN